MNFSNKHTLMAMKKGFSLTALATVVALGTGCSDPDDPDAGISASTSPVNGAVVDAYLAGATVYLDGNNNGKRDAWEYSAVTDKDGFFSTSADGNTDYCAADATPAQQRHCLRTSATGSGVIRAYGGFDIFTGEPFVGALAANVDLSGGVVPNQVISPLTSIVAEAGEGVNTDTALGAMGINNPDDANNDFLGESGSSSFDPALTNNALKLHKTVQLFEEVLEERFSAFGEEPGFPQTPSPLIYEALAAELANGQTLNSNTIFNNVLTRVNAAIQALYDAVPDLNWPGNASDPTLISDAENIVDVIDGAIDNTLNTLDDARSRMVGVEVTVDKMNNNAVDLTEVINAVENDASAFNTALQGQDVDFSTLRNLDFSSGTVDFNDAVIGAGGNSFNDLGSQQLLIDYSDSDSNVSGKALILFDADASGDAGTLGLCISYNDTQADEDDIYITDGTLIDDATWFTIDDRRMVLTVAGSYDLTLISRGRASNNDYLYSMGYGGETASWASPIGLTPNPTASFPTSDEDCKVRLNELDNQPQ